MLLQNLCISISLKKILIGLGYMAQVVEHECWALNSVPSTTQKKKLLLWKNLNVYNVYKSK
jgi:hypothetical protein